MILSRNENSELLIFDEKILSGSDMGFTFICITFNGIFDALYRIIGHKGGLL